MMRSIYRVVAFYLFMAIGVIARTYDLCTGRNGKWIYDTAMCTLLIDGETIIGEWNVRIGSITWRSVPKDHHFKRQLYRLPHDYKCKCNTQRVFQYGFNYGTVIVNRLTGFGGHVESSRITCWYPSLFMRLERARS
jgi:hypothetical protein